MDIGTISSRYAKALFSLAKDKEQESRVYDDMKMLADSFSMEPELRGALSNPIVSVPEVSRYASYIHVLSIWY